MFWSVPFDSHAWPKVIRKLELKVCKAEMCTNIVVTDIQPASWVLIWVGQMYEFRGRQRKCVHSSTHPKAEPWLPSCTWPSVGPQRGLVFLSPFFIFPGAFLILSWRENKTSNIVIRCFSIQIQKPEIVFLSSFHFSFTS